MPFEESLEAAYWALAWIPTPTEWIIVKTSPFEVLCECSPKRVFPRLSIIAGLLGCAPIQVNLEDSAIIYSVECDSRGASCIVGTKLDDLERDSSFDRSSLPRGPTLDASLDGGLLDNREKAFILNPQFNDVLRGAFDEHHAILETFGTCLTTLPPEIWDNAVQVEYLRQGKQPPIEGCITAYFAAPWSG